MDCGSLNIQHRVKPQPFRCNDCRKDGSVKTGSIMHGSKLPLKTWGLAMYILLTGLRGTSSMKMHRDLGVTRETAWHLAHQTTQGVRRRTKACSPAEAEVMLVRDDSARGILGHQRSLVVSMKRS